MDILKEARRKNGASEPDDPPYAIHRKHYVMHAVSGLAVFALGILADIAVGEIRHRWPHRVRWNDNAITIHRLGADLDTNFWTTNLPTKIKIGFAEDGSVYWTNAGEPKTERTP